jgi:hypothetical protein
MKHRAGRTLNEVFRARIPLTEHSLRLIIAGVILVSVATYAFAQQDTPTLKETLEWMQNTLDSGAGSLYMSQKDGSTEKREVTLPDAKSCEVSFQYQTGLLENYSYGIIKKPTFKVMERFNFKDIDPTTIESGEPTKDGKPADIIGSYVIFNATTRDNAKLISNNNGTTTTQTFTSDSLIFELPYPYADRFTKAFKHAVTLCGGKASSF